MDILQRLIDLKARSKPYTLKIPKGDDKIGVTDEIWDFLCPKAFSSVTKEDIADAIADARSDVDASALLLKLNAQPKYSKKEQSDFQKLFSEIISQADKFKIAKTQKPLAKIKPGGSISGGVHGPGSNHWKVSPPPWEGIPEDYGSTSKERLLVFRS